MRPVFNLFRLAAGEIYFGRLRRREERAGFVLRDNSGNEFPRRVPWAAWIFPITRDYIYIL